MVVNQLEPYQPLIGVWHGNGTGGQGPFDVRAEFEERGRWILLRHEIYPPKGTEPFYVSTQVFGFDDKGLTLDYFDTAGSFHFAGDRKDRVLEFSWKNDDLMQESTTILGEKRRRPEFSEQFAFQHERHHRQEGS